MISGRANLIFSLLGMAGLTWIGAGAAPDEPKATPEQAEFFESRVRPLFFAKCFSCHGGEQQQGSLKLDSAAGLRKGSAHGPIVSPGDPEKSALIRAVRYTGKIKMPPTGKLSAAEVDALTTWVKMGAAWPDSAPKQPVTDYAITDAQRKFWSFQPVRKPALPAVRNKSWPISPIDRFILAHQEQRGIAPAPPADRRSLIRRAYFDLIGLPPTHEEIEAFINDKSPDAFAKVVDRLLASPRYGERWGRHWLDVARYADTRGYVFTEERVYKNAYTYRDYVIRAFNEDLPYDRFVVEQLAADKLPLGDDPRPLAAMGFLTVGRRFLNNPHDIIDDRIDVTARGFLGLTVACARCHDHKFDPIPTKDYYSLYGVFASSVEPNPPLGISPKPISGPYQEYMTKLVEQEKQATNIVRGQVRFLRGIVQKEPDKLSDPVKKSLQRVRVNMLPPENELAILVPAFETEARENLRKLRESIAAMKKSTPPVPEFAMAMTDSSSPVNPHVLVRGNPNNQGPEVPRQFLAILSGPARKPFTQGSGRLELAQAIATKENPLTARVLVNRVWHWHFGTGLVRTPSDFGTRGERPTHADLLDYLAARFMEEGWSIKKLHRLIMLSRTYMQSSECGEKTRMADPENRLVSRMSRQRLDLEAMRDTLLYVTCRLDEKIGGASVELTTQPFSKRRTVYGFIERQNLPGMYRTFDFASPDSSTPKRFMTMVPQQALYLMNSPFVVEQARFLASREDITNIADPAERIRTLYRIAFGREPAAEDLSDGLRFVSSAGVRTAATSDKPDQNHLDRWAQYVQTLFMTNEFLFVD